MPKRGIYIYIYIYGVLSISINDLRFSSKADSLDIHIFEDTFHDSSEESEKYEIVSDILLQINSCDNLQFF